MSAMADMLREFTAAFDLGPDHPWWELVEEEWYELTEATDGDDDGPVARESADLLYVIFGYTQSLGIDLDVAFAAVHAANMAKLPDCEVCHGFRDPMAGVPGAGWDVCDACQGTGKGKPIKRASDGKVLKPKDWQPPDMSGAIR